MDTRALDIVRAYSIPVVLSFLLALFVESYYINQDGKILNYLYNTLVFIYTLIGA